MEVPLGELLRIEVSNIAGLGELDWRQELQETRCDAMDDFRGGTFGVWREKG